MTTFEPSLQLDLFPISDMPQTLSSGVRLAKTQVRRTRKAKESTATAQASSSKRSDSSEICDRVGALLKMSLASELAAQTGCSAHWRRSDTPLGRSWWVLTISERATSGSEYGSLLSTPRKSDMAAGGHGDTGRMGTVRHMLHQAMLPTPTKSDGGAEPPGVTGRKLRTYLATPAARDFRSAKASEHTMLANARPLNEQLANAEMMLTPTKTGNLTAPSMAKWAGAMALAKMLASHGLTGTAALPVTYGWMQGYAPGHFWRSCLKRED
jgi:hypothetical protein